MTLPKEIRNIIYMFVFCDDLDHVCEPVRYMLRTLESKVVMADVPTRVYLDKSSPPSKGTILACRELYDEMKGMQAAAYRAYWSNNRFVYDAGRLEAQSVLPADKDLQHVQQFCLVLRGLPKYEVHIVFEGGKWDSWLLPANGRILGSDNFGILFLNQRVLKKSVTEYMASVAPMWASSDPRAGRGLTCQMLQDLSVNGKVIEAVECQSEFENSGLRVMY